jgi:hypothetical protein
MSFAGLCKNDPDSTQTQPNNIQHQKKKNKPFQINSIPKHPINNHKSKMKSPDLLFNPHIRGLNQVKSCVKLSQKAKLLYSSIFQTTIPVQAEFPAYKPRKLTCFQQIDSKANPNPSKAKSTSLSSNLKSSCSPYREGKIIKHYESRLSEAEEAKIDEIVKIRLQANREQIRNQVSRKINRNKEKSLSALGLAETRIESLVAIQASKE